jgi:hypothetical protein
MRSPFAVTGALALVSVFTTPATLSSQSASPVMVAVPSAVPANRPLSIASGFDGFAERCSRRGVACVESAAFDDRPNERVSTLVTRIANVRRRCAGTDCHLYMRSGNGPGWCEPMYFIDGNPVDRAFPENALADVERALPAVSIRGIEVYRSEQLKPVDIVVPENCGVILIWSR